MSTMVGRRLQAVGSGVALLALLVGIPLVLMATVGWPLPDRWPAPSAMLTALQQGNVPAEVVVNALAVVVWLLWAQLAWAVGWELAVNGRRLTRGLRTAPAPLVAGPLNALAVKLVTGVLAVGILAGASSAAITLPATPSLALVDEGRIGPPLDATGPAVASARTGAGAGAAWLVGDGDSLWSIANTALGDGARSAEVLALNPELASARSLRPGMVLELPLGAAVPDTRRPTADRALAARPELVDVARGDNLWRLSEQRLESAGLDPSAATIAEQVSRVVADNRADIHDPDLIYPGQVFELPKTN